ncbi:hypothetical protein QTP70_032800, partial [Hemibagrus guttatus]
MPQMEASAGVERGRGKPGRKKTMPDNFSLVEEVFQKASLGIKAGYTLDGVPTHRRAHTPSHSHTTDNLEMPINLPRMSLDWERKPEYPEETPEAQGEHANSTNTAEAGIKPPTLE